MSWFDVADTEGAGAGDEDERRRCLGEEDDSEERPFPWLPEQTFVAPDRRRSQLSTGRSSSSFRLLLIHLFFFFIIFFNQVVSVVVVVVVRHRTRCMFTVLPFQPLMEFETFSTTLVLD